MNNSNSSRRSGKIPQSKIENLLDSTHRRCQAVIDGKAAYTTNNKYNIKSSMSIFKLGSRKDPKCREFLELHKSRYSFRKVKTFLCARNKYCANFEPNSFTSKKKEFKKRNIHYFWPVLYKEVLLFWKKILPIKTISSAICGSPLPADIFLFSEALKLLSVIYLSSKARRQKEDPAVSHIFKEASRERPGWQPTNCVEIVVFSRENTTRYAPGNVSLRRVASNFSQLKCSMLIKKTNHRQRKGMHRRLEIYTQTEREWRSFFYKKNIDSTRNEDFRISLIRNMQPWEN